MEELVMKIDEQGFEIGARLQWLTKAEGCLGRFRIDPYREDAAYINKLRDILYKTKPFLVIQ